MLKLSLFESYEVAVVIGANGRVMAFCLSRPGLNPGMDSAFFQLRFAVNLLSLDVGLDLMRCNRKVHTFPSSFLFLIIICHCKNLSIEI